MPLYRKFTNALAGIVCAAMVVMCAIVFFKHGFSTIDSEKGEVIYFFQTKSFLGYFATALAFLVSVVVSCCSKDLPQLATAVSLLPFAISFYEMAFNNIDAVVASVVLLLAMLHIAGNVIAWIDRKKATVPQAVKDAEAPENATQTK